MTDRTDQLRAQLAEALAALGERPDSVAYDASLDPDALVAALATPEGKAVLVRAAVPLGSGEGDFGPVPLDGVWLRIDTATRTASFARLCGPARGDQLVPRNVDVRSSQDLCCDGVKCQREREWFEVVLRHDDGDIIVLESADHAAAHRVARSLASALAVGCDADTAHDRAPPRGGDTWQLTAIEVAQWSLRREAGRWVVRDRASLGPRAALPGELFLASALIIGATVCGWLSYRDWVGDDREHAAIYGVSSLVMAIAAFAVSQIALHSARYRAEGAPVLFAYRDRFVASPWVTRAGAIDLKPEGRYGAALAIGGIEGVTVERDGRGFALVCQSDHGAIELGVLGSERLARTWQRVLSRVLATVAHALIAAILVGCPAPARPIAPLPSTSSPIVSPPPSSSAALVTPSASASAEPPIVERPRPHLPMIDDDVAAALAKGKSQGRPVVVDVWAAWCHTCLSMKSFVLPDPAIAALAERVVFAAVDSENVANSDFMERYRVGVWPTFFVLDPDGKVLGLWEGSASVEEMRRFITDAVDARDANSDPALAALLLGIRGQAAGKCGTAAPHYQQALTKGGASFARRGEALKGLIYCQARQRQWQECVDTGIAEVNTIAGTSAPADFASALLDCAGNIADAGLRDRARRLARDRLKQITESPPPGASVDDRSDALAIYAGELRRSGDVDGARAAIARQIALLEEAAVRAPEPAMAATFDYARMNIYLATGRGEKAVAMLTERCKQMPDNYEPHGRLAQVLSSLGRYDEALVAIESALGKVKGPRRIRYLTMQADILAALRNTAREREVVKELVAAYEALPPSAKANPNNASGLAEAKQRLRALR